MERDGILQSVAIEVPFLYLLSGSLHKETPLPRKHWLGLLGEEPIQGALSQGCVSGSYLSPPLPSTLPKIRGKYPGV